MGKTRRKARKPLRVKQIDGRNGLESFGYKKIMLKFDAVI